VEQDAPVLRARLLPLDGIDELRGAVDADVEVLMGLGGRMPRSLRGPVHRSLERRLGLAGLLEVDDLDRLPARENHALHEVGLFVVAFHLSHPLLPVSAPGHRT
jgi:hypothetical protein